MTQATAYEHVVIDESGTPLNEGTTMKVTELGCPLYTQDDDLLAEARRRRTEGVRFAGVIYSHQFRIHIYRFVENPELIAKTFDPVDLADRVEFIPF